MKKRQPEAARDTGSARPLMDKLGVKPGMRIGLIAFRHAGFEAELQERGAKVEVDRPRRGLDMLFYLAQQPALLLEMLRRARRIAHRELELAQRRGGPHLVEPGAECGRDFQRLGGQLARLRLAPAPRP